MWVNKGIWLGSLVSFVAVRLRPCPLRHSSLDILHGNT